MLQKIKLKIYTRYAELLDAVPVTALKSESPSKATWIFELLRRICLAAATVGDLAQLQ